MSRRKGVLQLHYFVWQCWRMCLFHQQLWGGGREGVSLHSSSHDRHIMLISIALSSQNEVWWRMHSCRLKQQLRVSFLTVSSTKHIAWLLTRSQPPLCICQWSWMKGRETRTLFTSLNMFCSKRHSISSSHTSSITSSFLPRFSDNCRLILVGILYLLAFTTGIKFLLDIGIHFKTFFLSLNNWF